MNYDNWLLQGVGGPEDELQESFEYDFDLKETEFYTEDGVQKCSITINEHHSDSTTFVCFEKLNDWVFTDIESCVSEVDYPEFEYYLKKFSESKIKEVVK